MTEFRKHVLPRFINPGPWGRGERHDDNATMVAGTGRGVNGGGGGDLGVDTLAAGALGLLWPGLTGV